MATRIDMSVYTFPLEGVPATANVADFRQAIAHLEDLVNRDYHACVSVSERAKCLELMKRFGGELIGLTCKRATLEDWNRRESAIERSTKLLTKGCAEIGR